MQVELQLFWQCEGGKILEHQILAFQCIGHGYEDSQHHHVREWNRRKDDQKLISVKSRQADELTSKHNRTQQNRTACG